MNGQRNVVVLLVLRDGFLNEHVVKIQIAQGLTFGSIFRNTSRNIGKFKSILKENPSHIKVVITPMARSVNLQVVNVDESNLTEYGSNYNESIFQIKENMEVNQGDANVMNGTKQPRYA